MKPPACLLTALLALPLFHCSQALAATASEEMVQAANQFLSALQPPQSKKAAYEWADEERFNWHFVPRERKGLSLKEMSPAQRHLAQALLASGMSSKGHFKAATIMSLEQVLHDLENNSPRRDPELYFVTIFGTPQSGKPWGWRLEGHHLAVNFTLHGEKISGTPSFFGSNPADIKQGPRKGTRILAGEEDLARKLVQALGADLQKSAVISTNAPKDIISSNVRKATPLGSEGLAASRMNQEQRHLLEQLIREYLFRHRNEVAEQDLKKINQAGFEKILFAWAGGLKSGEPHYYRVQGPTFLLEYDNTQNDNNHVHAVWRDFENDFGLDLLKEHYQKEGHAR